MTDIKPLEQYWVVVRPNGMPIEDTIKASKPESVFAAVKTFIDWKDLDKQGYTCEQVNITFTPKRET